MNKPMFVSMRAILMVWCFLLLGTSVFELSILSAQTTVALANEVPRRELFVPFEELDLLIGKDTNRVYMKRAEYEQLKRLARVRIEQALPLKQLLLKASYRASITDGRATIQGELEIELLDKGWHALPLAFSGVGILAALLDEKPAALAKNEQGQTLLFAEGIGKHTLKLDMVLPVAIDAAQQTLQFQLPTAAVGRLSLSVPGNVEVKSGAVVVSREVNADANVTMFEILPSATPMSILMSLNNKKLREQSTVIARGVLVAEITQGYERLHATMSMGVLNGAIDEFRFALADDLDVNSVTCDLLSRWSVDTIDGQRQLVVKLRSPATERLVINARLDRLEPQLDEWTMPRFQPINVAGYSAVVGLLIDDRLKASAIEPTALIAIDSSVLTSALPPTLLASGPDAPQLKAVAAFYAAQAKFALAARFNIQPRYLTVNANSLVTLSDLGITVAGGFSLMPKNEKLFFADFLCPADWSIDWVRTTDQHELKFDRFPATDAEAGIPNANATRVRVLIPAGIPVGGQLSVLFQSQHTPADWLSDWKLRSLAIPRFPVIGADTQLGAVAVQLLDHLTVVPETIEGLLVMNSDEKNRFHLAEVDTALAYRYETTNWQAAIKIAHVLPRMTAQVLSFVQLQPESLVAHTELVFTVDQARSQRVTFSLPESTPAEIAIRGLSGVVVKESSSVVIESRRIWTVQLAERQLGTVRLAIDFTQRLDTNQKQRLPLPIVRAEKIDYQSGKISVEGHSELEVDLSEHPRSVDIGELVDAEYQVGKRLLGAYGYVGNLDLVTADIARIPVHRLPTTIVERAELVTLASTQGLSQTAARFHLRTNATYLEVRLPPDAELWSVMLNGKPALPQREHDRVLIALPANQQMSMRDLQLVYETRNQRIQWSGQVNVIAPDLYERDERTADGLLIPIADLKWELVLPNGYRVTAVNGNLSPDDSSLGQFSVPWLLSKLWRLGGGRTQFGVDLAGSTRQRYSESVDRSSVPMSRDMGNESFPEENLSYSAPGLPPMLQSNLGVDDLFGDVTLEKNQQPFFGEILGAPIAVPAPAQAIPTPSAEKAVESKSNTRASAKGGKLWALEGVRSLTIELNTQSNGEHVYLTSLGIEPRAEVTVVNQSRLNWLALLLGVVVFCIGAFVIARNRRSRFIFISALAACIAHPLTGWDVELAPLTASVLLALLTLVFFSLICFLWTRVHERIEKRAAFHSQAPSVLATASIVFMILLTIAEPAVAQDQAGPNTQVPGQVIANAEQLAQWLSILGVGSGAGAVTLPADAIVIPYDPSQSEDVMQAEKLLVPFQTYVQLWNRAHPDKTINDADLPAGYAWSAAAYTVDLEPGDSLRMTGSLTVEQFTDQEIVIPLQLSGCVLEMATLDGKPPRLQMLEAQPMQVAQQAQTVVPNAIPSAMFMLYSQGKGRKQLDLTLRWKLDKNSGWRVIDGIVPSGPACKLTATVPLAKTEVRFSSGIDRSLHETSRNSEKIITSVSSDGRLSLQWRDKISEATVDQGLTVQARSVFDIQEDSLKFSWHGSFEFRRGRRESLTLQLPSDYLVQKVVGNNIRGWTTKENGSTQQLDVELLKAVAERESFSIFISKQSAIDPSTTTEISVPQIKVPDAMLQQGHVAIRRSLLLELRTGLSAGVTRIDALDESQWLAGHEEPGPLLLRDYQAYRYSQVPFELKFATSAVKPKIDVRYQSLLKISQREKTIETRLLVDPSDRPIYRLQISAPAEWKLQAPELAGEFQWSIIPDGARQRLQIFLANGQIEPFPIILHGQIDGALDTNVPISLPKIDVVDALNESGEIVVQADPAYDVRTETLQGCETALLETVSGWLAANQRESTRMVIRFSGKNYDGSLRVSERTPIVSSLSVTNVRVTDRAIEETIFIEANIRAAGIREFAFLLPASMANSRIQAPLLRQKNIVPVPDRTDVVRVQLLLQNEIMGQFRVVVEHDHELTSEQHVAPIPVIETGTTDRRLITLENVSRDELVTKDLKAVERLERSQLQQRFQSDLLVGKSSEAYLVREGSDDALLTYVTTSREVLATAGARIGLAQSLIVVDELGAYRATQEFRIENRTEPFLEIELPKGARLWTVSVAGETVKPAMAADASSTTSRRLRMPLVKTAEGDLDYAVVLKYGGQMPKPSWFSRVEIPMIHTVNINAEMSQVRLRLPEAYKWFNFDGTLGRVESEADLQAGWLSFRTRQLSDLTQLLSSSGSSNDYSKARASSNLKQLEDSLRSDNEFFKQNSGRETEQLRQQLEANSAALQTAQQHAVQLDNEQAGVVVDNRDILNGLYSAQSNGRSLNALDDVGQNFIVEGFKQSQGKSVDAEAFQQGWLAQNKLEAGKSDAFSAGRIAKDSSSVEAMQKKMMEVSPELGIVKQKLSGEKPGEMRDYDNADTGAQSQRYRVRLKQQMADQRGAQMSEELSGSAPSSMPSNRNGEAMNSGGMGGAGMGGAGMGPQGPQTPQRTGRMMFGGAVNSNAGQASQGDRRIDPFNGEPQSRELKPINQPIDGDFAVADAEPQAPAPPADAYMASLDVDLPLRGREYLFSTPRGDARLTVQGISQRVYQRLTSILLLLVGAAVIFQLYRWSISLIHTVWGAWALVTISTLVGALSLVNGYLPIYGCLAILAAIVIVTSNRHQLIQHL